MRLGLVLGKFMPVHTGHMALIDFALNQCDQLIVFLCFHKKEPIDGRLRKWWIEKLYSKNDSIQTISFEYDPEQLSDSSVSSFEASRKWAGVIKEFFPSVNILFSSEMYGQYVADALEIQHSFFDEKRKLFPVSSFQIRQQPLKFWSSIPNIAKPYFIKKIAIVGTESTGKSTLTEKLAEYYKTTFVAEAAREIINHTEDCTYDDLKKIALYHANSILEKQNLADRFLFVDTEINITKSYSQFLFGRELVTEEWIEKTNRCDLYIFLEPDCPLIQDGSRLDEEKRLKLDLSHKGQFQNAQIKYISITGNWEERFTLACNAIDKTFLT